jgi:hypothetical protein
VCASTQGPGIQAKAQKKIVETETQRDRERMGTLEKICVYVIEGKELQLRRPGNSFSFAFLSLSSGE